MDIDISPVQADELGLLGRDSPQTYCRKCDINQIYNDIWLRARNIWYANGLQLMLGTGKRGSYIAAEHPPVHI